MVKNDFSWDVATLCHKEGISQAELARRLGVTKSAVGKRSRVNVVTQAFIELVDMLGYDIEVQYIKRV